MRVILYVRNSQYKHVYTYKTITNIIVKLLVGLQKQEKACWEFWKQLKQNGKLSRKNQGQINNYLDDPASSLVENSNMFN